MPNTKHSDSPVSGGCHGICKHASHNDAPKGKALDATTGPTFPMASMEAQNTLNDMMRTRNRPEIFISYSSKAGPDMMALADAAYVPFRSAELDGWTASAYRTAQ